MDANNKIEKKLTSQSNTQKYIKGKFDISSGRISNVGNLI